MKITVVHCFYEHMFSLNTRASKTTLSQIKIIGLNVILDASLQLSMEEDTLFKLYDAYNQYFYNFEN